MIKEIRDKKSAAVPSVEEMKESARKGSVGKGMNEYDLNECMSELNQGADINE